MFIRISTCTLHQQTKKTRHSFIKAKEIGQVLKFIEGISFSDPVIHFICLKGPGHVTVNKRFVRDNLRVWGISVYKSLCLTKWWTMKPRVGLSFLSPEFEWDQVSWQVWVVFEFSISFQQFPLFVELSLLINASLSFQPNSPVRSSLLLACCTANMLLFSGLIH